MLYERRSQNRKNSVKLLVFVLLGSADIKSLLKILVKLSLKVDFTNMFNVDEIDGRSHVKIR